MRKFTCSQFSDTRDKQNDKQIYRPRINATIIFWFKPTFTPTRINTENALLIASYQVGVWMFQVTTDEKEVVKLRSKSQYNNK